MIGFMLGTRDGDDRPPPEKTVTFFNASKANVARFAGKILEPPASLPMQLVDTSAGDGEGDIGFMRTRIVEATEKKYTGYVHGSSRREDAQAYAEALALSRTFVLTDSFFVGEESLLQENSQGFVQHGLEPLKSFYENGGTVIVMCEEGIYAIGEPLKSCFGCDWRLTNISNETCVPSEKGKVLFGQEAPELYAGKGHFISAPADECLYHIKVVSEEVYKTDYYGLDPDEYSPEDLKDCKQDYERHVKQSMTSCLLAVHENEKGGRVIWMGDRNQEDPKMRAVFAKLCCGDA